ncbi:uncharacterized protein [Montipora foliosa]|uniref:uncharacterized protein n=1 Tax=Montipora foliosa TaxID=591990 RepID=UPI0035F19995
MNKRALAKYIFTDHFGHHIHHSLPALEALIQLNFRRRSIQIMSNKTVALWENTAQGGQSMTTDKDVPDLTKTLPNGANSIQVGDAAGNWQAFVNVNYGGAHVQLNAGQLYNDPGQMGLNTSVKSIRKSP